MQQLHVPWAPFRILDHVTYAPGGGAWGTALAIHAARTGHKTLLWAREPDVVASVNGPARENTAFLPVGSGLEPMLFCFQGTGIAQGRMQPCSGTDT